MGPGSKSTGKQRTITNLSDRCHKSRAVSAGPARRSLRGANVQPELRVPDCDRRFGPLAAVTSLPNVDATSPRASIRDSRSNLSQIRIFRQYRKRDFGTRHFQFDLLFQKNEQYNRLCRYEKHHHTPGLQSPSPISNVARHRCQRLRSGKMQSRWSICKRPTSPPGYSWYQSPPRFLQADGAVRAKFTTLGIATRHPRIWVLSVILTVKLIGDSELPRDKTTRVLP